MAEASTVYLVRPIPPSNATFVKGFITQHNDKGVWMNDRDDGRGESTFYPIHMVELIKFNTGWR